MSLFSKKSLKRSTLSAGAQASHARADGRSSAVKAGQAEAGWSGSPDLAMPKAGAKEASAAKMPRLPAFSRRVRDGSRLRLALGIVMIVLAIMTAGGALFAYFNAAYLLAGPLPSSVTKPLASDPMGAFISPPYTPAQINALRHLSDHMSYKQLASLYVARMSLDEKLGQLIMVEYADDYYSEDLNNMITNLHAGGVILYEFQMQTFAQTKHDIALMQQHAKIPLLISTDEEGGPYVHRLNHIYGPRPSAWDIYQSGSVAYAEQQGHKMAHDLLALGINVDLAPDVDVMLVPGYDTVTRTFGTTAQDVIKYAGPFMAAMQQDGLIACIKHYPGGLGNTTEDAHKTLPSDNRSASQIYSTELAPYKYFAKAPNPYMRPGMIMSTDVLMPAIDPEWPGELSYRFMTQILRQEFGYDGVVITDALYMQGIAQKWDMPQAAVLALNAGNDMLLGPTGSAQTLAMINGLKAALQDGRLSILRVNEAVTRILALKMQYHLMPAVPPSA